VFQFTNDTFMNAFEEVLEKMKTMESGFPWLNFAVGKMGRQETRGFAYGLKIQLKRQGLWPVTSLATYVPCAESEEEAKERFCSVAETGVTFLTNTD
jgi:hypothetical protein